MALRNIQLTQPATPALTPTVDAVSPMNGLEEHTAHPASHTHTHTNTHIDMNPYNGLEGHTATPNQPHQHAHTHTYTHTHRDVVNLMNGLECQSVSTQICRPYHL